MEYNFREKITHDNIVYSCLGRRVLLGDITAVKYLYGQIWKECPALIRTISLLQLVLTVGEIENDVGEIYCPEFLYYWGMICVGEQSSLILKDLDTAEYCFQKIVDRMPKVRARLAYIGLLKSDDLIKSELNVEKLDALRRWAGQGDIFSSIVLAKITFYQFLLVHQADNSEMTDALELPARTLRLLDYPCQKGHPVAIRFYNAVMECIGTPEAMGMRIDESNIIINSLFDFETAANIQIGCYTL